MRRTKPLERRSFIKGLLHALGINRDSAMPLPSNVEARPSVRMNNASYTLARTAWQEAEQAKAKAIIELQRKSTI